MRLRLVPTGAPAMPCTATALGEGGVAAPIFDRRSEAIGVVGPRERVFGRWPAI